MNEKEPLFQLIKSLTKAEKIFFKKQVTTPGKVPSTQVRLFDAIDKMKQYDERKLGKLIKGANINRRLAFEKNYLKGSILDSLWSYRTSDKNYDERSGLLNRLEQELFHAQTLRKRGIREAAHKLICKIKKEAEEADILNLWLEALSQEQIWIFEGRGKDANWLADYEDSLKQQREVAQKLENLNHVKLLNWQVKTAANRIGLVHSPEEREELLALAKHPILHSSEQALTTSAARIRFSSLASIYLTLGDKETSLKLEEEIWSIEEANPRISGLRQKTAILCSIIITCSQLRNKEKGEWAIEKLKALKCTSEREEEFVFAHGMAGALPFYFNTNQHEKLLEMESRIWELLQAKGDFTLITLRLNAYPCYMSMHLRMENFFRAGDWLELIRDEGDTNAYHHLPVDLFMMGMVAYFELGNHSIISSLCRTISRIINKTERAVQAEKVFMRYIQKPPAPLEEEQYWVDFKKALSPLKDQPHEKVKFEYFDFIAWIDSKIEKRPLGELLKERQQPIP